MSTPEQLMANIRQLLQHGRYADAASACREALGEAPDNADLRMLMGLCEEAAGRSDSARAWMEKSLEKNPEHPAAGFHAARLLLIEGRDDDARQALDRCIAVDPNHAAARTLLARIDQRAGRGEAAIEGLRTALVADDQYAPAHAGLAVLLLRRGELEEAHTHAAAAVRLRPDDALTQVTMAQVFQAQGHFDFADQCLRNALEKQPEHAQLRAALEQLERVRDAGMSEGEVDSAVEQLKRMRAHYRQGQLLAAAELADVLQFRFEPADPVLLEVAEVLMDAGQIEAATDVLARADNMLPRHALNQARLSAVRGDLAAARQALSELFNSDLAEIRHDARRLAADLHLRERQLEPALEVLRPLADEPGLPPATVRMLAQLEHAAGETATARRLLEALLQREDLQEGERAVSHNLLGRVLDESGAYEAAGRHLAAGGWRRPFLVEELAELSPDALQQAWRDVAEWPFGSDPVDDSRSAPCFVSGWPGSGREALLPALLSAGRMGLLSGEELMRRREILRLPAGPDVLAALSESDLRLGRKRYLRGAPQVPAGLLEPGQIEVTALPAVARLFPGATLLWLNASEAGLKLHWRLAGCREVERMAQVWRAEQALFEHLSRLLPLNIVALELDALLDSEAETLARLAAVIALDNPSALAAGLKAEFGQAGYRGAGHWRHYPRLV